MKHLTELEKFLGLDVRTLASSKDLADALIPVGDVLNSAAIDFNEEYGTNQGRPNSTIGIKEHIGGKIYQTYSIFPTELDYGASINLVRHDPVRAKNRKARITIPLTYRTISFSNLGFMYSPEQFFAQSDNRTYEPFVDGSSLSDTRVYARLAQFLISPLVDHRKLGYPLVWSLFNK